MSRIHVVPPTTLSASTVTVVNSGGALALFSDTARTIPISQPVSFSAPVDIHFAPTDPNLAVTTTVLYTDGTVALVDTRPYALTSNANLIVPPETSATPAGGLVGPTQPSLADVGGYVSGTSYAAGTLVKDGGQSFIARTGGVATVRPSQDTSGRWIATAPFVPPLRSIGTLFPAAMSTPPTIAASSTGTGAAGAASPIASTLNNTNNQFTLTAATVSRFTQRNGGPYGLTTQNSVQYVQSQINNIVTAPETSMEFNWVGLEFAVMFRNIIAGSSYQWVWIDGVPATPLPVAYADGTTTAGQPYWLRCTFADATLPHHVKIWLFACDFGRVAYAAGGMMTPVLEGTDAFAAQKRMVMYGDSWIDGASVNLWDLHAYNIPRLLDMEGFRSGQGATGYMADAALASGKSAYTDPVRLGKIAAVNPDYVYIHGVQNDYITPGQYTPAQVGTAAASVYVQLAGLAPQAKLIVVPSSFLGTTFTQDMIDKRTAVMAAAAAAPNVIGIIDTVGDAIYGRGGRVLQAASGTAWITGTGNTSVQRADGTNADQYIQSDQQHLTRAGHRYWTQRSALCCQKIMQAA